MTSSVLQLLNEMTLVRRIHHLMARHGGEARLVGGVVRDTLYHDALPGDPDLDMAMTTSPQDAMAFLAADGLNVLPTGIDHGTITVFDPSDDHLKIHLTTLREDVATDGRHANVAFITDWHSDAARRDLTINAIYLSANGTIYDPFGGRDDLINGRVLFIGDADARIKEDYLRILRFFRFHAGFADTPPDQDAVTAIENNMDGLAGISGERITMELDKILAMPRADPSLLASVGVSHCLTENGFDIKTYERFLTAMDDIMSPSLAGRYAALIPLDQVQKFAHRLRFSNHRRDAMRYITAPIADLASWDDEDFLRHAWPHAPVREKSWAPHAMAERYTLAMIRAQKTPKPAKIQQLSDWTLPQLPVKGRDLIAAGFTQGQDMGDMLSALEDYWLARNFTPDKDDLLSVAAKLDIMD